MASGPINSWQIEGDMVEVVTDFLFLGSKITEDGDCSHEIRRCLLLGKKAMTDLDGVLKSRDITLLRKVLYSQGYGLPSGHVQLWEVDYKEDRVLKNWSFWTMVLEKTPESPLDSKETKPVNLKGNQPWILVGSMLKLKLQYFFHLMWTADSLEKSLMLWKIEGRRRRWCQRVRWLDCSTNAMDMNLGKLWR